MSRKTPRFLLSVKQRKVLEFVERYVNATAEPCPASFIARAMSVHHSTVQEHLGALHRHGWLRAPNPPAFPAAIPRKDRGVAPRKDRGTANFAGS